MNSERVIVFAGTTEGRMLSEFLGDSRVNVLACVSTEFGKQMIVENEFITVSSERLGDDGLRRIMSEGCSAVVDATHPYAKIISGKIRDACKDTGKRYIRLLRPEGTRQYDDIVTVPDIDSAVEYLKNTQGNILVTTGSKELEKFTKLENYKERVFGRVLSTPQVSQKCSDIGFEGENIFSMKGPFCEELNYGMLRQVHAKYLVTKDSGEPGGFEEKIRAAEKARAKVILVGRPEESETGHTYEEVVKIMRESYKIPIPAPYSKKKRIAIVGIGMGDPDSLTEGARNTIENADIVIGASRMVASVHCKTILEEYRSDRILTYLREHDDFKNVVILVSGDTGFNSASRKLLDGIDRNLYDVEVKCGISSVSYLCSKTKTSWDDAYLISAHGKNVNIIGNISRRSKVISLMDGAESVQKLCKDLLTYELDHIKLTIGQDFGSPNERIVSGKPSDLISAEFGKLCVVLLENPDPVRFDSGISDEEFIRGDAPMTKSEIRTLSVSKMRLDDDSVVYDVGAGTGSVSIEMSMKAINGKVFAIEKEEDALDLIRQNKIKFKTANLEIIHGTAPDALIPLPSPTHVFIGGSSGNMKEILSSILSKNPNARIIINSITLETIGDVLDSIETLNLYEEETISVSVSRSKKAGRYHLMNALNPVYITVLAGSKN
jgi:precorrin-6x reductase